jgi:phosphoglycolate phosphatase
VKSRLPSGQGSGRTSTPAVRPAAMLFDLDGTLADSFAAIREALNASLREHGLPEFDLAWVRTHVGRGAPELVRDAVGHSGEEALRRSVGERFGEHYRQIYLDQTPAMPGAGEVLAFVAERLPGRVAVISNKYEELCRAWLAHWGLAPYVSVVVGPDTYGVRKPDPRAPLSVLNGFGVVPGDALLVGDMEVDVATARAAGVPMVAVQPDPVAARALRDAGAEVVLGALTDLPGWLAENGTGWGYHEGSAERGSDG